MRLLLLSNFFLLLTSLFCFQNCKAPSSNENIQRNQLLSKEDASDPLKAFKTSSMDRIKKAAAAQDQISKELSQSAKN